MFESFLKRVAKRDSKSAKSKKNASLIPQKEYNSAPMELSSFRPLRCAQAPSNGMEQQHVYDEINDNAYVYVFETNEISGQIKTSVPLEKNVLDSSDDSTGSSSSACSSLSTRGNSKRVQFSHVEKHTFGKKLTDLKQINNTGSQLRSTNSILKKSNFDPSSSASSCSSRFSSSSIPSSANSVASENNFDELVEHFVTRLMCKTKGTHNCNICNKYLTLSESGSNSYSICGSQINAKENAIAADKAASDIVNKLSCRVSNLTLDDLKKRKKLMDSA